MSGLDLAAAALKTAGRLLAPFLPWLAVAALGAAAWNWAPWIGPEARLAGLAAERDAAVASSIEWRNRAAEWEAAFRAAEGLRVRDRSTAQAAATSLIQQCSDRVAEARASARVIERIVTKEPTYDQNRCPARELVDPRLLRDALAPGSGTGGSAGR